MLIEAAVLGGIVQSLWINGSLGTRAILPESPYESQMPSFMQPVRYGSLSSFSKLKALAALTLGMASKLGAEFRKLLGVRQQKRITRFIHSYKKLRYLPLRLRQPPLRREPG
jgi:hypothetical protein